MKPLKDVTPEGALTQVKNHITNSTKPKHGAELEDQEWALNDAELRIKFWASAAKDWDGWEPGSSAKTWKRRKRNKDAPTYDSTQHGGVAPSGSAQAPGIHQAFGVPRHPTQPVGAPPAHAIAAARTTNQPGQPVQLGNLGVPNQPPQRLIIPFDAEVTMTGPQMSALLDSIARIRRGVGCVVHVCESALAAFRAEGNRIAEAEDVIGSWLLQQGVGQPAGAASASGTPAQ